MNKSGIRKSLKAMIIIISLVSVFSLGIYIFKTRIIDSLKKSDSGLVQVLTDSVTKKPGELTFISFGEEVAGFNEPKKYAILLQNSMELRPGGGYIGTFAEVEVDNGKIINKQVHNTNVYDGFINNKPESPFLIKKYLNSEDWGLRDSNWHLDFEKNAQQFMEIYSGNKEEDFDGVIAVTTNILPFLLDITGPIALPGIDGEFTSDNALEKLEYEVQVNYYERNIDKGERKKTVEELLDAILEKIQNMSRVEQIKIANEMKNLLDKRDIQLYFKEEKLSNFANRNQWSGRIITREASDYLSIVDINLGALKTNRCLNTQYNYLVDFTQGERPKVNLNIIYNHTCKEKDFMTREYHGFVRVYTGQDSSLISTEGFDVGHIDEIMEGRNDAVIATEKNKKYFGNLVYVPMNTQKSYSFTYYLDQEITPENYKLYYQLQSGLQNVNLKATLKTKNGEKVIFNGPINKDLELSK